MTSLADIAISRSPQGCGLIIGLEGKTKRAGEMRFEISRIHAIRRKKKQAIVP
jgi:hypothetical protein